MTGDTLRMAQVVNILKITDRTDVNNCLAGVWIEIKKSPVDLKYSITIIQQHLRS